MLSSQSYSKFLDKLLAISYRQHRPSFKSSKKPLSLLDYTSRFYSSNYYNKNYRPVGSLSYISDHQRNFITCSGQFRTVNNLDFTLQRRNFSIQESFDSALVTHSAIFKSISESFVVEKAQHFIIQFHDSTGLPWWLSIILTTCIVRLTLTLPLALYQVSNRESKLCFCILLYTYFSNQKDSSLLGVGYLQIFTANISRLAFCMYV